MTAVPVNERPPSFARAIARRIFRKRTLTALAAAGALVLVFHYLVMPWLVRDRVRAALDAAGIGHASFKVNRATLWATEVRDLVLDDVNRVDRIDIRYNVRDLWHREVDEIVVRGAALAADPRKWPIERKQTPTATTRPKQVGLDLPFNQLRFEKSQLLLADGQKVPFEGTLVKSAGHITFRVHSPESGLELDGKISRPSNAGRLQLTASHIPAPLINAIARTYVQSPAIAVSGVVDGGVTAAWSAGDVHATGAFQISGGSIEHASDAKLTVASGVFAGEANIGPTTRPSATIKADRAEIATADLSAVGVSGAVTLTNLSPPTSAPRQKLSADRLKIGQTEFANGQLEFDVNPSGDISIRQTRWDFLGGQVYASDVKVPRNGPVKLTLRAENVDLRDILTTYATGKLDGKGKLSGELPIVIDGRDIRFGEGRLTSLAGGQLQIRDPDTLAQVSEVAGGAAAAAVAKRGGSPDQIKHDIAEALKDFEYDQMTARLTNDPDGLAAYIVIKGHGRTGAKQQLVYEPRIHRLDQLLRLYLDMRQATDRPAPAPARAPASQRATTGKVEAP
jgi:hypothetical protein